MALIPEGPQKVCLSCSEGVERLSFQWPTLVELAVLFYGTGLIFTICRHSAVNTSKMFVVLSKKGQRGADEKVHVNALSLLISRYSDSKPHPCFFEQHSPWKSSAKVDKTGTAK